MRLIVRSNQVEAEQGRSRHLLYVPVGQRGAPWQWRLPWERRLLRQRRQRLRLLSSRGTQRRSPGHRLLLTGCLLLHLRCTIQAAVRIALQISSNASGTLHSHHNIHRQYTKGGVLSASDELSTALNTLQTCWPLPRRQLCAFSTGKHRLHRRWLHILSRRAYQEPISAFQPHSVHTKRTW